MDDFLRKINLVNETSNKILGLDKIHFKKNIEDVLANFSNEFGASRAYLYDFDVDKTTIFTNKYTWKVDENVPRLNLNENDLITINNLFENKNEIIIKKFNNDATPELKKIFGSKVKSLILISMVIEEKNYGFLGFDSYYDYMPLSEVDISVIKLLINVFATAKINVAKNDLVRQNNIQSVVFEIIYSLFSKNFTYESERIPASLMKIAQLLKISKAIIVKFNWTNNTFSSIYEWASDEKINLKEYFSNIPIKTISEMVDKIRIDKKMHIKDINFLKSDSTLKKLFLDINTHSLISYPIFEDKNLFGFICLMNENKIYDFTERDNTIVDFYSYIFSYMISFNKTSEDMHKKEYEMAHLYKFQALLMRISMHMINLDSEKIESSVNKNIIEIGNFVKCDRFFIAHFNLRDKTIEKKYEWKNDNLFDDSIDNKIISCNSLVQSQNFLKTQQIIVFNDIKNDYFENSLCFNEIINEKAVSCIILPIYSGNEISGIIGIENIEQRKEYNEDEITLLSIFSQIYSNIYSKLNYEFQIVENNKSLQAETYLQSILIDIAKNCINIELDDVENMITRALKSISDYYQADRGYIYGFDERSYQLNLEHQWYNDIKMKIRTPVIPFEMFDEYTVNLKNGKILLIKDVMESKNDFHIKNQGSKGIVSIIILPIMDAGKCIGLIGIESKVKKEFLTEKEKILLSFFMEIMLNINDKYKKEKHINSITDLLKKKNVELEKVTDDANNANRLKSEFIANLSHEIRTPLNGVIGFSNILKQTNLSSEQAQYVKNISTSSNTLLDLINDILDFSKIEAGQLELELIKSDIFEVFNMATDIVKFLANKKNIAVVLDIDPETPQFAIVDALRLKQIILNLLNNAVKFTEVGEVRLAVIFDKISKDSGIFNISVSDTGIGISKEGQKRLFKVFSQADPSISRKFGGTGLGLTISNQLAEKMGSRITVESEEGKGAKFSFSFQTNFIKTDLTFEDSKKYSDNEKQNVQDYIIEDSNSNNNYLILVADDVELNIHLVKAMIGNLLENVKYTIFQASNGEDAIKQYLKYQPDIIFMDVQMPIKGGFQATREIREIEDEKGIHTPIIALTAGALKEDRDKCLEAGMDDYIPKPIPIDIFRNILKLYLKKIDYYKNNIEINQNSDTSMHFDKKSLEIEFKNNQEFIKKMIYLSINQNKKDLILLNIAIEQNDLKKINQIGHRMKGSNASMKFYIMQSLTTELEVFEAFNKDDLSLIAQKINDEIGFLEENYLSADF